MFHVRLAAANATQSVLASCGWASLALRRAASAAVGKIISVYGSPLEIVGVSAPEFRYPGATDIWVPWRVVSSQSNRGDYSYQAVGRLASGVSLARAQAAMRSVGDNMARQYAENRFTTVAVTPLQERLIGNVRVMLWVLLCAVIGVAVTACGL